MPRGTKKASQVIFDLFRVMKEIDEDTAEKLYSVFEEVETLETSATSHTKTVEDLSQQIEELQDQIEEVGVSAMSTTDAEVEASYQVSESADELKNEIGVYKTHAQELEEQLNQVRNILGYNVNRQLANNNQVMQHQILEWYKSANEINTESTPFVARKVMDALVASILKNVTLDESSEDAEHIEQQEEPPINE